MPIQYIYSLAKTGFEVAQNAQFVTGNASFIVNATYYVAEQGIKATIRVGAGRAFVQNTLNMQTALKAKAFGSCAVSAVGACCDVYQFCTANITYAFPLSVTCRYFVSNLIKGALYTII